MERERIVTNWQTKVGAIKQAGGEESLEVATDRLIAALEYYFAIANRRKS